MERRTRLLSGGLILVVGACGGGGDGATPPPTASPKATTIQLSSATLSLLVGESKSLTAVVLDQRGQTMSGQVVSWASSDTTKVVIDNSGVARGVRPGTASLLASSGTVSATVAATVPAPELRTEDGASATVRVGVAGGTVSVQGSSGAKFSLIVPPYALRDSVPITLTPVTSIVNLPMGTTLVAAVRLRPDGLTFLTPASVTMELPSAPNARGLAGVRFADDGSALRLHPVRAEGQKLTLRVAHFSGAGVTQSPLPLLVPLVPSGASPQQVALQQLMVEELAAQNSGSYDLAAITQIFRTWYTSSVKPQLQAATSDNLLSGAIGEWSTWRDYIVTFQPTITSALAAALDPEVTESKALAATGLQAAIQRNNATCQSASDLDEARDVLFWQSTAALHALATPQNALDRATVLAGLCVKVRYGQVTFPDTVRSGQPATLRAQAGIAFGSGAPTFPATPRLKIEVVPSGSTNDASTTFRTDLTGAVQTSMTPRGGGPLSILLHSCIDEPAPSPIGTSLGHVCTDTTITRSPDAAVYVADFAGAVGPEWSRTTTSTSPNGARFLGTFQNETVTLSLGGLPAHSRLVVQFDVYAIDTWDGNHAIDGVDQLLFGEVNATPLLRTTVSNVKQGGYEQAYPSAYPGPSNAAGSGAHALNSLGYPPENGDANRFIGDAVYRITLTFAHTGAALAFRFTSASNTGSANDERWGLDNVRVSVLP